MLDGGRSVVEAEVPVVVVEPELSVGGPGMCGIGRSTLLNDTLQHTMSCSTVPMLYIILLQCIWHALTIA